MKTRLEQLARPVIGLALFGGFVLAFSGWAGVNDLLRELGRLAK